MNKVATTASGIDESGYLPVKESHIYLFRDTALFYQTGNNEFSLYKKRGDILDPSRFEETRHPDLFVSAKEKDASVREIVTALNRQLAKQCLSEELISARKTLTLVVNEAFQSGGEINPEVFPETIDILFEGCADRSELLGALVKIRTASPVVTEHTVNVMLLTLRYCIFHKFKEKKTKRMALCALLHDIGASQVDKMLYEKRDKLSESEYKIYKGHTVKGHDILNIDSRLDSLAATIALEHHERIDGSGYPFGKADICIESQLIGLIDCYEFLTYRDKLFRKAKTPFDSLDLIKKESFQGRFQKTLLKDFCSCLGE